MALSFYGTGTMWYGQALPADDGSAVTTEWITLVFVPLLPLGSKRVLLQQESVPWWKYKGIIDRYRIEKVPLHLPHVFKGYAITLGIVVILRVLFG